MKAMVCEMCQSNDLVKQDGVFVCQHCGTKYSIEEARKLMIEGKVDVSGSTVNIDSTKKLENLYTLARRAKDAGNTEDAAKYYSEIRILEPNNWEAEFYSVYFSALQCRVAEAGSAASNITNCLDSVLPMMKQSISEESKRIEYLNEISSYCLTASQVLYNALWNLYDANGYYNNPNDFVSHSEPAKKLLRHFASLIEDHFGTSKPYADIILRLLKKDIGYTISESKMKYSSVGSWDIKWREEKIQKYDPTYTAPIQQSSGTQSSGGCYVATAVYGSYDCPEVWTLRRFRDNTLSETWYGRAFIRTYYAISPTLVKWFGKSKWFKNLWKPTLDRMVETLNGKGVENTPYNDREW